MQLSLVESWLDSILRAAEGETVMLALSGQTAVRKDIEALHGLLRASRTCPALIVANVKKDTLHIGLLDLVLILTADRAVVEADGPHDDCPIAWSGEQPALEHYCEALFEDAAGPWVARGRRKLGEALPAGTTEAQRRPRTLADLRSSGMLSTAATVDACTASRRCMHSPFLLGVRRAGVLSVNSMDKMSFNFYWVPKVFCLNKIWTSQNQDGSAALAATSAIAPAPSAIGDKTDSAAAIAIELKGVWRGEMSFPKKSLCFPGWEATSEWPHIRKSSK